LRQLVASGADVVLVHTFCAEMRPDHRGRARAAATVAEFEALADHYGVGSVWAGLHAWTEVMAGPAMTWEEWLPDGLHPEERGSLSYAQAVIAFCAAEWDRGQRRGAVRSTRPARPSPAVLHAGCWDRDRESGPLEVAFALDPGPVGLLGWFTCLGMDRALHATVPGAAVCGSPSTGRGLVRGLRLRPPLQRGAVSGGRWGVGGRPGGIGRLGAGDSGWFRPLVVADDLLSGAHVCEIEAVAVPVPQGCGTRTTIGLLGAIG
jgi:hypothetical protein